jgi:hypothetical protein
MTWQPPPRPDWVLAVNRGDVVPISEEAAEPLDRDGLMAEARARLGWPDGGVADFGDDAFIEPLDVLLPALEEEAQLSILGRWMTRRFLLRLLEGRLQLKAYVDADPGVRDEEVAEPLVVTGVPRTGTTILHALLAEDPEHRAPEGWELLRPVPPAHPDRFATDARIPLADRELRLLAQVSADLDAIHEYRGRMTKECVSSLSFEFRSEEFTARYHVPSYVAWLQGCDLRPAYETHRLVLQVLQRGWPARRWVLKSPVHLHALPTLLAVYPDARLVVTHRDPLTVLPSVTSLVATLRWAHSDLVDFADIGAYHERLYRSDLDALVASHDAGAIDPARIHHVRYADYMASPLDAVAALYGQFGWKLDGEAERRMADHLARRPQGMHGAHHYSFADLGLDRDTERARFTRYQQAFAVPDEA